MNPLQAAPVLCLVTDEASCRGELAGAVAGALRGGVDWVQLRDRESPASELLAQLHALRAASPNRATRWIVNRRVDVAVAGQADGVHLGFDGMKPRDARALLGEGRLIGASFHEVRELAEEELQGRLSYAHLAPIFPPISKISERRPLGTRALERAGRFDFPILAQGGVCAENARACIEAGAAGVAVTGEILGAEDPEAAARALRDALDS